MTRVSLTYHQPNTCLVNVASVKQTPSVLNIKTFHRAQRIRAVKGPLNKNQTTNGKAQVSLRQENLKTHVKNCPECYQTFVSAFVPTRRCSTTEPTAEELDKFSSLEVKYEKNLTGCFCDLKLRLLSNTNNWDTISFVANVSGNNV